MRKRIAILVAAFMVAGLVGAAPAAADDDDGGTYLALGDSVAAGTQQPDQFTSDGYADQLFKRLRNRYGFDEFVNLSCPGEDTQEMIYGSGGASPNGSACYGPTPVLPPGGASQLDVAVEYLTTHPGEVELITIVIGANDVLACDLTAPPAELNACVAAQLGQIGTNLPVIVGTLQAAAPGVPIVAMNYYNPQVALWIVDPALAEAALQLTPPFNGTLEAVYGAFGVPVADVETAFKTFKTHGNVPANVRASCKFTLMCEKVDGVYVLSDWDPSTPGPQTDIHPSDVGHRRIAWTHIRLINSLGLLSN